VGFRFGGRSEEDASVERAWKHTQKALWRSWLDRSLLGILSLPRRLLPARRVRPPKWEEPPAPRRG
jgi:hypothetical protein